MTDAAAFRATYSDWKLIRSRKVVQIVLEVPLEASGQAYEVLGGMPRPDREAWCAIARLEETKEEDRMSAQPAPAPSQLTPVRASKPWAARTYAEQAGILCADPKFQTFLRETQIGYWREIAGVPSVEDRAAHVVRRLCDVPSRSEIRPNTQAENRWLLLVSAYRTREAAERAGAA